MQTRLRIIGAIEAQKRYQADLDTQSLDRVYESTVPRYLTFILTTATLLPPHDATQLGAISYEVTADRISAGQYGTLTRGVGACREIYLGFMNKAGRSAFLRKTPSFAFVVNKPVEDEPGRSILGSRFRASSESR